MAHYSRVIRSLKKRKEKLTLRHWKTKGAPVVFYIWDACKDSRKKRLAFISLILGVFVVIYKVVDYLIKIFKFIE
jgi:hypothetical protein